MAQSEIIEGTGEELQDYLKQAPKERFRLIHLSSDETQVYEGNNGRSLTEALKDYIGSSHYGDANLSENTSEKYARLLARKYRKEPE